MRDFLTKHQEAVLAVVGVACFLLLSGYVIWGATTLAEYLGQAVSAPPRNAAPVELFHIDQAKALNLQLSQ